MHNWTYNLKSSRFQGITIIPKKKLRDRSYHLYSSIHLLFCWIICHAIGLDIKWASLFNKTTYRQSNMLYNLEPHKTLIDSRKNNHYKLIRMPTVQEIWCFPQVKHITLLGELLKLKEPGHNNMIQFIWCTLRKTKATIFPRECMAAMPFIQHDIQY